MVFRGCIQWTGAQAPNRKTRFLDTTRIRRSFRRPFEADDNLPKLRASGRDRVAEALVPVARRYV
jgi:hypothetical protein